MREWTRAKREHSCGLCGARIYVAQPMLLVKIEGMRRQLTRCADCSGPAPPDLPPVVELRKPEPQPLQRIASTAASFTRAKLSDQDWTARILGERE